MNLHDPDSQLKLYTTEEMSQNLKCDLHIAFGKNWATPMFNNSWSDTGMPNSI